MRIVVIMDLGSPELANIQALSSYRLIKNVTQNQEHFIPSSYRLVGTSRRRLISISPGIDEQGLTRAHKPRRQVLPLHLRRAPRERVALPCEGAEVVLRRVEPRRQRALREVCWFLYM